MRRPDRADPSPFEAVLADAARAGSDEAHLAARDLLAPLVADLERSMRTLGLMPFRRSELSAYRATVEAGRLAAAGGQRLDARY